MNEQEKRLARNAIGTSSLFFFVIAAAAPLTSIAAFAPLAFLLGGAAAPLGFLVAGVVYLMFAVGFLSFVRHTSKGGAFYTYISIGLGRRVGLGAALVAYVSYALGQIGFCAAAGLFTQVAIQATTGLDPSWGACALGLALLSGLLAYCRVELNALVMGVLIVAEIGILVVFAVVVFFTGGAEGIHVESLDPRALLSPGIGTLLVVTFVVFIGFEQTALYNEEARDPKRTVPHATYLAIGFLALFYLLSAWSILIAIGPSHLEQVLTGDTANLVFKLAEHYLGGFASSLMLVLVVTSFFAGVLALQNASTRYLLAIARERMLPAAFATRNRFGMPRVAGIFQTLLVMVAILASYLAGLDPYKQVVLWTNTPTLIGVLALQAATSLAAIRYFRRHPGDTTVWQRLIAPSCAAAMLLLVLWLLFRDMGLLTGMDAGRNALLAAPLVLAFIIGCIQGTCRSTLSPNKKTAA
ncbi:TPA: APC family permease [Pseudomonas aeruginosa]